MTDEEKKEEYEALLAIFKRFLSVSSDMDRKEIIEELMSLRAEFAISHAVKGFNMDWEKALEIVRTSDSILSAQEQQERDILVAAIDNLVDFAVAEEYQMLIDVDELAEEIEETEDEDKFIEQIMTIFSKYNKTYAAVENLDATYAMSVAFQLYKISKGATLMYMTQGDERVRPWHLQFEGFTATKRDFPAWLIPPIEHQCRCYLVEVDDTTAGDKTGIRSVMNSATPEMPDWFNRTFKESVALGGRIFSDEHPYFEIHSEDVDVLREIADKIKSRYFNE